MSETPNDLRAKILIAEDDTIVALDLQGMVMRLGYDVVAIVDSGQAAIASAKRFQPDIILLDIVLSGAVDGIEVAREIHANLDVPIIFCVSSPDLSLLVRAKDVSFAGYLLKPINPDSLATTLDTALYKDKLEKRVKRAEARYRSLADRLGLFENFLSAGEAIAWTWKPGVGARVTLDDQGPNGTQTEAKSLVPSDFPLSVPDLERKIDAEVSLRVQGDGSPVRIALLLECPHKEQSDRCSSLIGISDPEGGGVSGLLLQLERVSR